MSYRLVQLSSNFGAYLRQFYAQHPDLSVRPYDEQFAALMYNAMHRSDFYSVELRKLGYATQDIIGDAEPLQKQWARENGVTYAEDRWMQDIALAQIERFQPDVLFITAWIPAFSRDFIVEVRHRCRSRVVVIGWMGEAFRPVDFFREHDVILTCSPESITYLQDGGKTARHLHHAFAPQILDRITLPAPPTADVGFVGNLDYGTRFHNNRVRMFHDIARQMDFRLYGEMSGVVYKRAGAVRHLRQGYYALLEGLHRLHLQSLARRLPRYQVWLGVRARAPYVPLFAFLESRLRPPVYGLDMYQTVAGFKIGLNAHGPSAFASNYRLYETTGVGTCLLTDWKQNLAELFAPDSEVVAYRSAEDAVEKVRYLLDHDSERRAIAAAGQQRTLRDHTYAQRAQQLDAYIREFMAAAR